MQTNLGGHLLSIVITDILDCELSGKYVLSPFHDCFPLHQPPSQRWEYQVRPLRDHFCISTPCSGHVGFFSSPSGLISTVAPDGLLKLFLALSGLPGGKAAEVMGISRATLYRWNGRLESEGLKGLEQRSRRPKRVRQRQWGSKEITLILELRTLYPRWGKEKLAVLARREGTNLSVRILKYIQQRGYLKDNVLYRPRYTKRRPKRPYAIRKPKDYRVDAPGDLVQIDTLDIHPFPQVHFKHFTARDVISRWDVVETFPNASSANAKAFLSTVIKRMPFPVKAVQVDGGTEFKAF